MISVMNVLTLVVLVIDFFCHKWFLSVGESEVICTLALLQLLHAS